MELAKAYADVLHHQSSAGIGEGGECRSEVKSLSDCGMAIKNAVPAVSRLFSGVAYYGSRIEPLTAVHDVSRCL